MWWLVVFILIDGAWVPGAEVTPEGWSPRAYETRAECMDRKAFAERALADLTNVRETRWYCTQDPDTPMEELAR